MAQEIGEDGQEIAKRETVEVDRGPLTAPKGVHSWSADRLDEDKWQPQYAQSSGGRRRRWFGMPTSIGQLFGLWGEGTYRVHYRDGRKQLLGTLGPLQVSASAPSDTESPQAPTAITAKAPPVAYSTAPADPPRSPPVAAPQPPPAAHAAAAGRGYPMPPPDAGAAGWAAVGWDAGLSRAERFYEKQQDSTRAFALAMMQISADQQKFYASLMQAQNSQLEQIRSRGDENLRGILEQFSGAQRAESEAINARFAELTEAIHAAQERADEGGTDLAEVLQEVLSEPSNGDGRLKVLREIAELPAVQQFAQALGALALHKVSQGKIPIQPQQPSNELRNEIPAGSATDDE